MYEDFSYIPVPRRPIYPLIGRFSMDTGTACEYLGLDPQSISFPYLTFYVNDMGENFSEQVRPTRFPRRLTTPAEYSRFLDTNNIPQIPEKWTEAAIIFDAKAEQTLQVQAIPEQRQLIGRVRKVVQHEDRRSFIIPSSQDGVYDEVSKYDFSRDLLSGGDIIPRWLKNAVSRMLRRTGITESSRDREFLGAFRYGRKIFPPPQVTPV